LRKLIFIYVVAAVSGLYSQPNGISWKKNMGGSDYDFAMKSINTSDGGALLLGYTNSSDVNVSGWHTGFNSGGDAYYDAWVVKIDKSGNMSWQKCFGGTKNDYAMDAIQTSDGGYFIGAQTYSSDGDVTSPKGDNDFWLIRADANGTIVWERSYGGTDDDELQSMLQLSDGSVVIAGMSRSVDGNVSANYGSEDVWVVKVSSQGWIQWQKNYGGSGLDGVYEIKATNGGGFVIAGYSKSSDNDLTLNQGYNDLWVFTIDSNGSLTGQSSLGGTNRDYAYGVYSINSGGFLITGSTQSNDGDVTGWNVGYDSNNDPHHDAWVLKLDASLNLQWQKCYGGSNMDYLTDIEELSNGTYLLSGGTSSTDGDITYYNGGDRDAWLINIDGNGNLLWDKCYGGDSVDAITELSITVDGAYLMLGYSNSNNGDIGYNYGYYDFWVFKTDCYDIDLGSSPLVICEGGTDSLSVTGSYVYYAWNNGASTPSISLDSSGQYYVEVSDINACKGFSDTIDVNLNPKPQASLQLVGQSTICLGDSTEISASSGFVSYQWNNGDVAQNIFANTPGDYFVEVTDQNGCKAYSDTISIGLSSISGGALNSTNGLDLCVGESTTLSTIGTFLGFQWSTGETSSSINVSSAGNYYAQVTDATGCSGYTDTISISILPASFNLNMELDEDTLISPPFEIEFKNTTPVLVNLDFIWNFGDGDTLQSNDYYVYHTYQSNGLYDVTLQAENVLSGCKDTLLMTSAVYCTGGFDNAIKEHQNMDIRLTKITDNKFMLSTGSYKVINFLKLNDIKGSELMHIKSLNSNEYILDLSLAEKGIYVLRVYTDLGVKGFKLHL
jgi:hypothetical protein